MRKTVKQFQPARPKERPLPTEQRKLELQKLKQKLYKEIINLVIGTQEFNDKKKEYHKCLEELDLYYND